MSQSNEIQRIIRERVTAHKPGIWGWPHDSFMNEPWGYAIHEASVGAWNQEGRQTDCVEFLLAWATLENIESALAKYPTGTTQWMSEEEDECSELAGSRDRDEWKHEAAEQKRLK